MMTYFRTFAVLLVLGLISLACDRGSVFSDYRQEVFPETPINGQLEKTVRLVNPHPNQVQTIGGIGFDGGGNAEGHFEIAQVVVADKVVPNQNIVVPMGGAVEVHVIYHPQKMVDTLASYGGWVTGEPVREHPLSPGETVPAPGSATKAIHRGMLLVAYHFPQEGLVQIELIGRSVPSAKGERVAGNVSTAGLCEAKGTTACFKGTFAIDIPGLMKGPVIEWPLNGAIPIQIEGGTARMVMDQFPNVLMVLKGNGPGEPLEGKPLSAISIVASGAKGITGVGTFDGSALNLQGVGMRMRVSSGELTPEDVTPTLSSLVDFEIKEIPLTTAVPYTNGDITLKLETKLSEHPSGMQLLDDFIHGAQVIMTLKGKMALPQ